ncbi:hypothetical protein PP175_19050 [Aneurinibacillus sp. Ricciae_BoGa-3]|uniref:hypothetical protein n=1 Tax=Aneurinibacillus sp. Ricciae_BoGa-3 TaxID=3022697 RepID=UPI002341087E|nr:hypothetical protein [Aneurinibacillus sp. Ricciae_BoGa-3]WCK53427.1 hypothetical protein PP175_19050 [Aneurinibacillus sp. Ricciae_BoGa-3]
MESAQFQAVPSNSVVYEINITTLPKDVITLDVDFLQKEINNGKTSYTEKVGKATLYIVNEDWISGSIIDYVTYSMNKNLLENARPLGSLKSALTCAKTSRINIHGAIAYLYHFEIFYAFRKQGLTNPFMQLLLKTLAEEIEARYVLLQAYPAEKHPIEEIPKIQMRLEKIYSKAGFSVLKSSTPFYGTDHLPLTHMYYDLSKKH